MDSWLNIGNLPVLGNQLLTGTVFILGMTFCSALLSQESFRTKTSTTVFAITIKTLHHPFLHNRPLNTSTNDIPSLVQRVHKRLTQSREAKWASVSLSAICILLVLGVCYSKMWKEYRGSQYYHPNLPVLKESVPLIDVLSRRPRFPLLPSSKSNQNAHLQEDEEHLLA